MKTLSLRSQIFISLIFLVLLSSVLIATVSIFQYNEQSKNYHQMRLERKESQLKKALNYVFKNSNNELFNENFYENIQEFLRPASDILNIDFYLYDLEGNLLTPFSDIKFSRLKIPKDIIESLENSPTITFIDIQNNKGERIRSSYSYKLTPLSNIIITIMCKNMKVFTVNQTNQVSIKLNFNSFS